VEALTVAAPRGLALDQDAERWDLQRSEPAREMRQNRVAPGREGPRAVVAADLALRPPPGLELRGRRAVLVAASDEPAEPGSEEWHEPCRLCWSRGPCQRRVSTPDDRGWACQAALDAGLIDLGDDDSEQRRHERWLHRGRPVSWWQRADGEWICGICHPAPPAEVA
jgi:hypothetical protein